ncbi:MULTISPECIES: HlyD family secretion protein [unclassified Mesorhizobium]|jgi:membrane fusion protein (multidrug efflux system)|uniref:HlyD family secretion protein n=1 Tax=unclassified Mesorhizobium TaxID=325217 RepID=UPI0008DEF0AE|nr:MULTISPECIES: HlyD family secretion protein [unclassified Mesorhizobium]RJG45702.1 HlyD family secretion protein [Mesorhizobium sp. DCY119]SFT73274.1 membrane fusion protein, multidrug efflux system [Mesorhizobium sp. YR577]
MNAVSKVKDKEEVTEIEAEKLTPPVTIPQTLNVEPVPAPARKKRRFGRLFLMAALPLVLVVGGGYVWVTGGRYQETENANLRQAKVTIASEIAGRIVGVDVSDNQLVKAGDTLFVVDPEPYRIKLAQADAALAAARLDVERLRASYSQALSQERVTANDIVFLQSQFDRAADLSKKGINAKSSLDEARRDLTKAQDEHAAAVQGIASARAALGGDPDIQTDKHPTVLSAIAARDQAAYSLAQTTVRAPADGIVAQASSFKLGQFVGAGTALFSLVETGDTWVDANFKETQLTNMKPGQEADITLDTYPGRPLKATVQAIGAGTGAEFSLLPAQNATGNWVKVTQRIPVRLKVNTDGLDVALRTGMSASVSVDTGVSRGFAGLLPTAHAADGKAQ